MQDRLSPRTPRVVITGTSILLWSMIAVVMLGPVIMKHGVRKPENTPAALTNLATSEASAATAQAPLGVAAMPPANAPETVAAAPSGVAAAAGTAMAALPRTDRATASANGHRRTLVRRARSAPAHPRRYDAPDPRYV